MRNPAKKPNIKYLPVMPDAIKADYSAYTKTSLAFPNFIHKGTGCSVCYAPMLSDVNRDEYDEMCAESRRHLSGLQLVLS